MNKKTHEQYVEELSIKNPTIKVVDKYNGNKKSIRHYCIKHDEYFDNIPERILSGVGCPKCSTENRRNGSVLLKTNDQYLEEVKNNNPTIIPLETYKGANISILHKCTIHNIEWNCTPSRIIHGTGCYYCGIEKASKSSRKTNEKYIDEVNNINPNITVLGKYDGNFTPILHKCNKHNIEWLCAPASILKGGGCYQCGLEKLSQFQLKSREQYINELYEINKDVILLGDYLGSNTPTLHKCLIDGYEWYASPANFLNGCGCPQCNCSHGEKIITKWLKDNNIDFVTQKTFEDCKDTRELPFDFYLPKYNKCIEYDGEQHFRPIDFFGGESAFVIRQIHDLIKTEYCDINNIPLLRVSYLDENIETQLNNFIFN